MQCNQQHKDHGLICFYNTQLQQGTDWLSVGEKGQKYEVIAQNTDKKWF